uniref:GCR116 n=1 Tax=Schmidtea mediterranea TaxID=79327 RepID=A0A193KUD3_SCHMD|nr:GCR116 [Schmidtea mediterranea]
MNMEFPEFLKLYYRFINTKTKWREIQEIYPIIKSMIKNSWFNTTDLIRIIDKRYDILLFYQSFQNIVQYLLIFWVIIFIVGTLSNGCVIFILTRVENKSVYDIICVGLALTDLLILIVVIPITTMWYSSQDYFQFSDVLCPIVHFIVYVALFSSASMLLTLTVTRFLAVVHPWQNRMISAKEAKIACCIAWIIGGCCSIPVAIYFGVEDITKVKGTLNKTLETDWPQQNSIKKCKDLFPNQNNRTIYFILVFLLTYLLPFMSIILMNYLIVRKLRNEVNQDYEKSDTVGKPKLLSPHICSTREIRKRQVRNRVTKMVILVSTLYCVCWLPTQLVNVWYYTDPKRFPKNRRMQYVKFISQTLSFASTCINPIVYSVVNETFKIAVKKQCPCLFRVAKPSPSVIIIKSNKSSLLKGSQQLVPKTKLKKSLSDNSLVKNNNNNDENLKNCKKLKTNVIENRNVFISHFTEDPASLRGNNNNNKNNSNNYKKSLLGLASDNKKNKKSNSPFVESQASCSVFSFEGFTDNLDSTNDIVSYNLITKV